jgi:hypothetical protein
VFAFPVLTDTLAFAFPILDEKHQRVKEKKLLTALPKTSLPIMANVQQKDADEKLGG